VLALAIIAVAAGGWYYARERERKAERAAILQAAREHRPDAPERLLAHLARHTDDAEALEALVEWQLWAKAPFADVEPHLDRLVILKPDDLNSLRVRARLRIQNGRLEGGLADARRVVDAEPTDHNTRLLAAIAAAEVGQLELAVGELTYLLDSSPLPKKELALRLARNHLERGDAARADQVLDLYFPPAEVHAEAEGLRGRVHQVAGRHQEAAAVFRAVADKYREQREFALYQLAESLRVLGRVDDLVRTLDELDRFKIRESAVLDARQQPDDMPAQIRAAEVLLEDGKPAEAAQVLEQAMHRLGRNPAAVLLLTKAYYRLGRVDLANKWEHSSGPP
jgi:predicted Zn-dependent protease